MARLEGFGFGQLQEDPSSFNQIIISLRRYGIPYKEIHKSTARLSSRDCFVEYTGKLPDILHELYSSEYSRPLRAVFKFSLSSQPVSLVRGRLLEHTIDWERTPSTFVVFHPFCIPVDKVLQITKTRDPMQLTGLVEHPHTISLEPLLLTVSQGWLRATKDFIVDVYNTHQNPFFIHTWIEEVIERGRVLSEVELLDLFEKHDPFMKKKTLGLLKKLKVL